jgi:hypothetical protein
MNSTTPDEAETEILVRYARRSLWNTLVVVLLFGGAAALSLASPESHAFSHLATALPMIILFAYAAVRKASAKGARTDLSASAIKALLNDELRQYSMKLAYRNGFFAVLLAQPLLALAPTWIKFAYPVSFMACVTIVIGVVTMMASLLYYDR